MIVLLVAAGAALGAPARYLTDLRVQARHRTGFPWGTLTVNVAASLILGVLTGLAGHASAAVLALVGTGFCGALSTFSTFSYETLRLIQDRAQLSALANVVGSVTAGLAAAAAGWSFGAWLG